MYKLLGTDGFYYSKYPGKLGGNSKLKIYGKLTCPSANKWIAKGYYVKHRVFFKDEEMAKVCGYRPCGVCMRKEYQKWKQKSLKRNY